VLAIVSGVLATALPATISGLDEMRTAMAARYLAGTITSARFDAAQRSACVALRFEPVGSDHTFAAYTDGNGNGVRTADIADGTDPPLRTAERLAVRFTDVRFALAAGVPDLDGNRETADTDGVRIGTPKILTMSPDGTATSGTLYLRGRRSQYAVRVLGATGRTRVFRFHGGTGAWLLR